MKGNIMVFVTFLEGKITFVFFSQCAEISKSLF